MKCVTQLQTLAILQMPLSRSQLSHLITAKKSKSGPAGYVAKRQRAVVEGETSGGAVKKMGAQDQGEEELKGYLVH